MFIFFYVAYAALYTVAYVPLYALFTAFFDKERFPQWRIAVHSLGWVLAALAIAFFFSYSLTDLWWANRVQHALGGGAVAYFMCWRIANDARLSLSRLKTLVFCFLVVMALGVANELVESLLQQYTSIIFASDTSDTWLDLWSNTIGALGAGSLLTLVQRG